jgi:hypothetical protein
MRRTLLSILAVSLFLANSALAEIQQMDITIFGMD